MTTSEVRPNESRIQFISVIIVASGNPSGFVGSRDQLDSGVVTPSSSSTLSAFRGAHLREPIAVRRNQQPYVTPQVKLNLFRCAIEGCDETFRPTELLHPGAKFICKKHPRAEQLRAVGRGYDKKKDHADEEAAFQADNSTVAPINGGP